MEWHAVLEAVGEEGLFEEIVGYELGCVHEYRSDLSLAKRGKDTYGVG